MDRVESFLAAATAIFFTLKAICVLGYFLSFTVEFKPGEGVDMLRIIVGSHIVGFGYLIWRLIGMFSWCYNDARNDKRYKQSGEN